MKEFLKENERYWADRAEGYCQVNIDELRSNKKQIGRASCRERV